METITTTITIVMAIIMTTTAATIIQMVMITHKNPRMTISSRKLNKIGYNETGKQEEI
jgi:hypothetical protein